MRRDKIDILISRLLVVSYVVGISQVQTFALDDNLQANEEQKGISTDSSLQFDDVGSIENDDTDANEGLEDDKNDKDEKENIEDEEKESVEDIVDDNELVEDSDKIEDSDKVGNSNLDKGESNFTQEDSEVIEDAKTNYNITAYIDGANKVELRDNNTSTKVVDSWKYNEVKRLSIQGNVEGLDTKSRYVKVTLPLGMKFSGDVNKYIDGKTVVDIDVSGYRQESITANDDSFTYTPDNGTVIFKLADNVTNFSLELLVAVDAMFWSTVDGVRAHDKSNSAIEVSVGDKDNNISRVLDEVTVEGVTWDRYFDATFNSNLFPGVKAKVDVISSLDYIQNVVKRLYKKIIVKSEIPYYEIDEGDEKVKVYADLSDIKVTRGGTYRIEDGYIIFEWENVYLDMLNHLYYVNFEDKGYTEDKKVMFDFGEIYVQDYFSSEMIKVREFTKKYRTLKPSGSEQIVNNPVSRKVYLDPYLVNDEVLSHFGGINLKNEGEETKTKAVRMIFPYGDSSKVGVKTVNFPTLESPMDIQVEYTLWEKGTGKEYSNIVTLKKGSTKRYSFRVTEAAKLIDSSLNGKELYFKSISYTLGKLPIAYNNGEGYSPHASSLWGKLLDGASVGETYETKYYIDTIEDDGSVIQGDEKVIRTIIDDKGESSGGILKFGFYGMDGQKVNTMVAGEKFVMKGELRPADYPYFSTTYFTAPIIRVRLPRGFNIEESMSKVLLWENGVNREVDFQIINKTNPRVLSDGSLVYDIKMSNNDYGAGFFNEKLECVNNLTVEIVVDVSKAAKTTAINVRDTLYIDDENIEVKGSGSWDGHFVFDRADVDGDGSTTDKLATTKEDNILNVSSNSNWLEVDVSASLNDGPYGADSLAIRNLDDTVKIKVDINNTNEGVVRKDDFYYYIPVPKKGLEYGNLIKDDAESFDFNLNLKEQIKVPNGLDVLYTTDNLTYVPFSEIGDISKVSMIKLVATEDIGVGKQASIEVPLEFDEGSLDEDSNDVVFSVYGYQVYNKNGVNNSFNHVSDKIVVSKEEIVRDNWINREVAKQLKKGVEQLVKADYLKIKEISLSGCGLTGDIPYEIKYLKNIEKLNLSNNMLNDDLTIFAPLEKLTVLDLSRNNFQGSLTGDIIGLSSLEELNLESNGFYGEVPNEINLMGSLNKISLKDNQFVGKLPLGFVEKFGEESVEGNILDNVNRQKKLSLKNGMDSSVHLTEREFLDVELFKNNVCLVWNGVSEEIYSGYNIEAIINDEGYFNDEYKAIKDGITTMQIRLMEADKNNVFAATENITITIDKYLDLEKPTLEYSVSNKEWTNKDVIVTLTANDNEGIEKIVSYDGKGIFDDVAKVTVTKNGSYEFKAIDVYGNETVINVKITNIDKLSPKIEFDFDKDVTDKVELNIKVTDDISGVSKIYKPNGELSSNNDFVFIARRNGQYVVRAIDNAGNESIQSINITNIDDGMLSDDWLREEVANQNGKDVDSLNEEDYKKVTEINLPNRGIEGVIPADIGLLENLKLLNLEGNKISGSVPKEITQLSKLEVLKLGSNCLGGEIPIGVSKMTNLEVLDISNNGIVGEIPSDIGKAKNLRHIYLNNNMIGGKIPESIAELKHIENIRLGYNQFIGPVSSKISNMGTLVGLNYNFLDNKTFVKNELVFDSKLNVKFNDGENIDANVLKDKVFVKTNHDDLVPLNENFDMKFIFDENTVEDNFDGTYSVKAKIGLTYLGKEVNNIESNQYVTVILDKDIKGTVIIKYMDFKTGEEIIPSQIYNDLDVGEYIFNAVEIGGYDIRDKKHHNIDITPGKKYFEVEFYYDRQVVIEKGSVKVRYVDSSTGLEIAKSDIFEDLALGRYTYKAKVIDGYKVVGDSSMTVELTKESSHKEVVFKYKKELGMDDEKGDLIQDKDDGGNALEKPNNSKEDDDFKYNMPDTSGINLVMLWWFIIIAGVFNIKRK